MKSRFVIPFALTLFPALPVFAQRRDEREKNPPRANQGHIPEAPPPRREPRAKPEAERRESGHIITTPHVRNDHWYDHDRSNDKRFHVDHPFEHGRFEHFGPSYRYRIERFDREHHRFWLPGGFLLKLHRGIGPFVRTGVGIAAVISSSTKIPTTMAGTCSITFTPASTST